MKDFLKIGNKEIKEVPEEDEMTDNGENMVEKTHLISEEVSRNDTDSVDEDKFASFYGSNETSQQNYVPSDSSQCPQCDSVFKYRYDMLKHVRSKHEGVKYSCSLCDYKATQQSNLKRHIESTHEGVKFPCKQCDYQATQQSNLKAHIESTHESVIYPCKHCDYKATVQYNLKRHMKLKHI